MSGHKSSLTVEVITPASVEDNMQVSDYINHGLVTRCPFWGLCLHKVYAVIWWGGGGGVLGGGGGFWGWGGGGGGGGVYGMN